jgi:hypothetical protein
MGSSQSSQNHLLTVPFVAPVLKGVFIEENGVIYQFEHSYMFLE